MDIIKNDNLPIHQLTYQKLSEKILFGDLQPGDSITIQGAADMLNVGVTPVREALRRLIAEGALLLKDNRRISIPIMTKSRLRDLIEIRILIELSVCSKAINHITDTQISQLEAIDKQLDLAIQDGNITGYLQHNHAFHFYLYNLAQYDVAIPFIQSLWLQLGPYMRVICGRNGTAQMQDEHKTILAALIARNASDLLNAMTADIKQGARILMNVASK